MKIEAFILPERDWLPDDLTFPVVHYSGVAQADCETTGKAFENAFARNAWPPQWHDGVYDYRRCHSTAHEVLGVPAGSATLTLDGLDGGMCRLNRAMRSHWNGTLQHHDERQLPGGGRISGRTGPDMPRGPTEEARKRMASLPLPHSDPITGGTGH